MSFLLVILGLTLLLGAGSIFYHTNHRPYLWIGVGLIGLYAVVMAFYFGTTINQGVVWLLVALFVGWMSLILSGRCSNDQDTEVPTIETPKALPHAAGDQTHRQA
jgi:drug/metabolite transporter (DMT)-like permease